MHDLGNRNTFSVSTILFWILALIGGSFALAATVAAVIAIRRGESVWTTFKSWLVKLVDAISGIG